MKEIIFSTKSINLLAQKVPPSKLVKQMNKRNITVCLRHKQDVQLAVKDAALT